MHQPLTGKYEKLARFFRECLVADQERRMKAEELFRLFNDGATLPVISLVELRGVSEGLREELATQLASTS